MTASTGAGFFALVGSFSLLLMVRFSDMTSTHRKRLLKLNPKLPKLH